MRWQLLICVGVIFLEAATVYLVGRVSGYASASLATAGFFFITNGAIYHLYANGGRR